MSRFPSWFGFTAMILVFSRYAFPNNHPIVCTASIGVLMYLTYVCYIYPYFRSPLRNIPTIPNALPIFGHFFTIFGQEMALPQREWHRQYGPIIRYFFPLGFERISIADDEAIKEITVKNPYNFPRPARITKWMASILGEEGILLVDGAEHSKQRKIIAPAFSTTAIQNLAPVFWKKGLHLTNKLVKAMDFGKAGSEPQTIELLDWLNRATLDIISLAAFGVDIDSLDNPEHELRIAYRDIFFPDIISAIMQLLMTYSMYFRELPFRMCRSMKRAQRVVTAAAGDIIRVKLADESKTAAQSKDVISLVVKEGRKTADPDERLSFSILRDQVMAFLGAGHDTTATATAWCLHLLAKNPLVQARLHKEIIDYFPELSKMISLNGDGGLPDELEANGANEGLMSNVDSLPYLQNVCRESLRFIPPIPLTSRVNINSTTLVGYEIPAGTFISVCANAINHLETFWGPSAGEFDPDRWDNLPETWVPNAFMSFLAGPRGCIGRKFAETEMKVLLCCLLSVFSFEIDGDWADPEVGKIWRLVLKPKDGMHLKVRRLQ